MNFVFISPHFPTNYWNFVQRLHQNGVNVLGIGDCPYEQLRWELRDSLTEYYRVDNMENYDEMLRAMGYFTFRYGKIDWVESNNEYWLEQDAQLRTDFNITTGLNASEISRYKSKSGMKAYYEKAGIPVARYHMVKEKADCLEFIKQVGYPVVAKPDSGVGSSDNWKIKNEADLNRFLAGKRYGVQYIMEEFVDGEIVTFDGISGRNAEIFYATSHVSPDSIMDAVNEKTSLWYYVDKSIADNLRKAGEATIKAFDARNRFFHCEFFRLKTGKPGLGKKGDIVGLEVNMRPAGGFTVDMENFAGSLDLYQLWADMVAFGEMRHPLAEKMQYCVCATRRDKNVYSVPQEEIYKKYNKNLVMVERLPEVLADTMGNMLYIACFDTKKEMDDFSKMVITTHKNKAAAKGSAKQTRPAVPAKKE